MKIQDILENIGYSREKKVKSKHFLLSATI